jgi:hypothetical protein
MADSRVEVIDGGSSEEAPKRTCFIVSPIGDEGGDVRRRSDHLRTYIIGEALEPLGYTLLRADLTDTSGDITEQIVNQLLNADLIVADLTDHNPNVFYELALRHAFGKPFIHVIRKGERIPFDIAHQRTVFYDLTDLDSVYAARRSVHDAAKEILAGGDQYKVVSPVTRSVDIDQLRRSDDPEQVAIADIKQSLYEIRSEIRHGVQSPGAPFVRVHAGKRPMPHTAEDIMLLRRMLTKLAAEGRLRADDLDILESGSSTSETIEVFAKSLRGKMPEDPWSTPPASDPWGGALPASDPDEESPF